MTVTHRCPTCNRAYPAQTLVCPECHTILVKPGARPRTPAWVIATLVAVILLLLGYALYLVYQVLVLHRFS